MANRKSGKDTSVQGSGLKNVSNWESGVCCFSYFSLNVRLSNFVVYMGNTLS